MDLREVLSKPRSVVKLAVIGSLVRQIKTLLARAES